MLKNINVPVGKLKCQQNSFAKSIETIVISCVQEQTQYAVILEDTVIFPTGGGQPFDTGFINQIPVLESVRRGLDCVHIIPKPLTVGDSVTVQLDWERYFYRLNC
jgi:Ser-tRNA(Ala) deacylase AlaX